MNITTTVRFFEIKALCKPYRALIQIRHPPHTACTMASPSTEGWRMCNLCVNCLRLGSYY